MSTFKRVLPLVAIPVIVWTASVGAAEIAFRLLGATPPSELEGLYEQLPHGNYKHRAWVDADANWYGAKFSVHTDQFGFRCDAQRRFAVDDANRVDVLIVGDSQAYGQGVEFGDSVAGTLIEQAARQGLRAANAATGGHYLPNQLELVRQLSEHADLRAKHLLIVLTPYLVTWPDTFGHATVGPDGRLYAGNVTRWKEALVRVKTHTVLYSKIRDALRATILPPQTDGAVTNMFLTEYQTGPSEARRMDALSDAVTSFQEWATTVGADVQLVYAPLTLEFEFDALEQAARAQGVHIESVVPYRIAAAAANRLGLPLYDLRPTLNAIHAKGQALSLKGDPHYNPLVSVAAGARIWQAFGSTIGSRQSAVTRAQESKG